MGEKASGNKQTSGGCVCGGGGRGARAPGTVPSVLFNP